MRAEEGMAFRRRAVGAACLPDTAAQKRRIVRLANNDLRFRSFLLQHPCNALKRAARTHARNPIVEPVPLEILENFDSRGLGMEVGVGFIFELSAEEPAVRLG